MKYTLGTICKLNGIDFEIIIIGYNGKGLSSDYVYEYVGCLYNEGFTGADKLYRFNQEHIEKVLFEGYKGVKQDSQEVASASGDKDEYIFDENGVLVEVKKAKVPSNQVNTNQQNTNQQNTNQQVTLQSIDIDSM